MLIETSDIRGYKLMRIGQGNFTEKDLDDIRDLVAGHLKRRVDKIALCFDAKAYPYSKLITLLIKCDSLAKEAGADLAIIQPNEDFADILTGMKLTSVVRLLDSEDALE
ncbi:MAG: hypothetical protein GF401_05145 [Chitinivibrionales bacterium]|nr:hypothetical protein [Chitinivibrionales bacterium]